MVGATAAERISAHIVGLQNCMAVRTFWSSACWFGGKPCQTKAQPA